MTILNNSVRLPWCMIVRKGQIVVYSLLQCSVCYEDSIL